MNPVLIIALPHSGQIQVSATTWTLLGGSGDTAEEQWLAAGSVEVKGKGLMDTHVWMMPPGFMQAPVNAAAAVGAGWCTEVTAAAAAGVVKDAESDNGLSRHSSDSLLIKLFSSSAQRHTSSAAQRHTSSSAARRPSSSAARRPSCTAAQQLLTSFPNLRRPEEPRLPRSQSTLPTPNKTVFRLGFKDQREG